MTYTMKDVLEFVGENDVKFIRLAFCDILGVQKNISIAPYELERAFRDGISFDASAICGFSDITRSDLLLMPDPATLSILPWRPTQGRVVRFFCEILNADKTPFVFDMRNLLKQVIAKGQQMGYNAKMGTECEFYLVKTDEEGNPTKLPHDEAGYFDIAPLDKGENVRREICLSLEEMGIKPEASHHEQGPGQNEIDFAYGDPLSAADHLITFKSVVKAIAARNGLFASFMPKPFEEYTGSGLHINISLHKNGHNIFKSTDKGHSEEAESFIAGILKRSVELTAFLNPIPNSYKRLGSFKAPKYVSWSHQNRSQLIRIPASTEENLRMELRAADPAVNPYLAFALLLGAGFEGIEENLKLPKSADVNLYSATAREVKGLKVLPSGLEDAVAEANRSKFVEKILGAEIKQKYLSVKRAELAEYVQTEDKEQFEFERYFKRI